MRVIEIRTEPARVFSPDCKVIQEITVFVDQESLSVEQEVKIKEFFKTL
jgi:hypothetical protein